MPINQVSRKWNRLRSTAAVHQMRCSRSVDYANKLKINYVQPAQFNCDWSDSIALAEAQVCA